MCIGETLDSLAASELADLRRRAGESFPAHIFAVQVNAERMSWVVLEPPKAHAELLRFTFCRISPCIMIMVEDEAGRRQICSAGDIDAAIIFARDAADRAALAAMNVHPPHAVCQ